MADDVVFIRQGRDLVALAAGPYEAEAVLQDLLEQHPQLLAGYQMHRADPRRFLLVRREAAVPDHESGGGRWSVDHLFLDQDAVPTLVEVKRGTDPRIRREVVGQMLDYAANAARYWADSALREMFEQTCAKAGRDPDAVLEEVIGADGDAVEFWARAGRNLRGGALRLVFAADVIPDELRAVIEFLNARMTDTEVYGVEIRRYGDTQTGECYVPRLVGATAAAAAHKQPAGPLEEQLRRAGPDVLTAAGRLRALAEELSLSAVSAARSLRVCDRLGAVILLYPTYRSLEFPLERLTQAGHDAEAANVREGLQRIAGDSRQVTATSPNIGCRQALDHWDEVTEITRSLAQLRKQISSATGTPD